MNYYPEAPINPPEDTRHKVYRCEICDEGIYEGDDYYNIPGLGICCTNCIDDAKHYNAERDYEADEAYEMYRDEVMMRED